MSHKNSFSRKQQRKVTVQQRTQARAERSPAQQLAVVKATNAALKAAGCCNSWNASKETNKLLSVLS